MNRAKWKGPYIDPNLTKHIKFLQKKKSLPIISRNSTIIPKFIGLKFNVHTGKNFLEISVSKEMVGHKFGEFSPTRGRFSFKKKKKKKSK
uniref:Small ribosomal subunit protein uS19c n=1 Tax=Pleurosigma inscriptura TaxID=2819025 RepID=A0A8A3SNP8_9STRA|nr:ribosomal protein S19 [Pleurosigma inscriptura]QSZ78244.1 ribosomal protein S19 [Pleurosigma inscriptura]